MEPEFAFANAAAAHEISNFLQDPANRLFDELSLRAAPRHVEPLKDAEALGLGLPERLHVNESLAWISYRDRNTGRFVGGEMATMRSCSMSPQAMVSHAK
jgi:hypothetical protein